MITWVNKESLYDDIETPFATDDLFIKYFNKTPLYNGLYKYEMVAEPKIEIESYEKLTFKTYIIDIDKVYWLNKLIQILLYRMGYHVNHVIIDTIGDYIIYTPTISGEYVYMDPIDLDIEPLIGYKALIDDDNVSIEILASDLIWLCDLSLFKYDTIYDIPVIPVNGTEDLRLRTSKIEFAMNPLLAVQSNIYTLLKNTFYYPDYDKQFVTQYGFKILKENYLQHDLFDKYWLEHTPSYMIDGDWVLMYESNVKSVAYLKYAAIRAYVDIYQDTKMMNRVNDIKVGFDLLVSMPINSDKDIEKLKNKINIYMTVKKNNPFIYVTNKNEAIATYLSSQGTALTFPFYDEWVVVSNRKENINVKNNVNVGDEIIGIYDINNKRGLIESIPIS